MEGPCTASFWNDALRASQTVKWSVLVLLVLFGVTQLVRLKPRPRGGPYWTLLDLAYTVLLLGPAVLIIVNDVGTRITSTAFVEKPVTWNVATDAALAVSLVTITILSWSRLLRVQGTSSFAFSLLGLLAIATAVDVVLLEHRLSAQKVSRCILCARECSRTLNSRSHYSAHASSKIRGVRRRHDDTIISRHT